MAKAKMIWIDGNLRYFVKLFRIKGYVTFYEGIIEKAITINLTLLLA